MSVMEAWRANCRFVLEYRYSCKWNGVGLKYGEAVFEQWLKLELINCNRVKTALVYL